MKSEKSILIAFILNLIFSVFEFLGGFFTGSVAIISDAIHDMGDATSIGISWFLEKKSKKQPDEIYTYGYARYSIIGAMFTTLILIFGSAVVIHNAVKRISNPVEINYDGMIILAIIGVIINFTAAKLTHGGESLNQKAVNLHMLEDVLGWIVVLIGAIIMRFTDFYLIDPIMSIGVALFILFNAVKNMKEVLDLFLEKIPEGLSVSRIKEELLKLDGVENVHHIHIRSLDGHTHSATMHIVTNEDNHEIKHKVKDALEKMHITHSTLELETPDEHCHEEECHIEHSHHHHHHH